MVLETKRLILRNIVVADGPSVYECCKDEYVGPAAGWLPHPSVEYSRDIIKNILMREETYGICYKDNEDIIGCISLSFGKESVLDILHNEGEIGFWLGRNYWGKGIMAEALEAVLSHGFMDLRLKAIYGAYFQENIKSKNVFERCNFTYNRTLKDQEYEIINVIKDIEIMKLTYMEYLNNIRL